MQTEVPARPMTGPPERPRVEPALHGGHDVAPDSSGDGTYLGRKLRGLLRLVGNILAPDEGLPPSDHDLAWTSLSRTEHDTVPPSEVEKLSLSAIGHPRCATGDGPPAGSH